MAVYDDQQTRPDQKELDSLNEITGISPAEEQAMEDRAITDDIAERNQLNSKTADVDARGNSGGQGDDSEIPFKNDTKKRRGFRVTKKQAITGGIVGLLVGGGLGVLSILTGPLQIVHAANLLKNFHFAGGEYTSTSRVGRFFEFYRTQPDPSLRNVSYPMEKVTTHHMQQLSARGVSMEFNTPSGNNSRRISGLTIDPNTPDGARAVQQLNAAEFNVSDTPDGKKHYEFRSDAGDREGTRRRRQALKIAAYSSERGVVANAITKRLLIHRAGVDFHPFRNMRRTAGENVADLWVRVKERRAERVRTGQTTPNARFTGAPDTTAEGEQVRNPDSDRAAGNMNREVDNARRAKTPRTRLQIVSRLAGGTAALVGTVCMAKNIGNAVKDYQYASIVLPMMRMGMSIVTMGSQVMSNQNVNMEELGAVVSDFYDEETGTSFMSGRAMQATARQPLTGPDSPIKPTKDAVNNKPALFNAIDSIPGVDGVCGIQEFVTSIPIVGRVVNTISGATEWGMDALLSTVGLSTEKLMESLVAVLAGDIVDPYAKGAVLGNYAAIGTRLAANDAAIATGGVQLTNEQATALRELHQASLREEFQNQNLATRLFNTHNSQSLLAQTVIKVSPSTSMQTNIGIALQSFSKIFTSILSSPFSLLTSSVGAQDSESYDFGVEAYGFSVEDLESEDFANPYVYIKELENEMQRREQEEEKCIKIRGREDSDCDEEFSDINELNTGRSTRWPSVSYDISGEQCFGTSVSASGQLIQGEAVDFIERPEACDSNDIMWKRYRFYLLDTITAKSLACYEGIDDSACNELGFDGQLTADVPQESSPSAAIVGSTSETPCAPGTNDLGVETGYSGGNAYSIRLCGIPGFVSDNEEGNGNLVRVNSTVSGNWLELYERSQNQRINLRARGSFRSMERQSYFWNCYQSKRCNGGKLAARPGWSNHQMGFSVDIVMDGSDLTVAECEARKNNYPIYRFLAENAPALGIQADVSSECWHWTSK